MLLISSPSLPDSTLHFCLLPPRVVYNEVIQTAKYYMRDVTAVESSWLLELAPHFYQQGTVRNRHKGQTVPLLHQQLLYLNFLRVYVLLWSHGTENSVGSVHFSGFTIKEEGNKLMHEMFFPIIQPMGIRVRK